MSTVVELGRDIKNDDGYVDALIEQINAIPSKEKMVMNITTKGGDTDQGERIYKAVDKREGETTAVIIGTACSMGVALLTAFDNAYADKDANLMFHAAASGRVDPNTGKPMEPNEETRYLINRFNEKTYNRFIESGADEEFVRNAYLRENQVNFWLTAQDAEKLKILKVLPDYSKEASVIEDTNKIVNDFKNENSNYMALWDRKVSRVVKTKGGDTVIFNSKKETLEKGDMVTIANSTEIPSEIVLENNMKAFLSNTGEVLNMEEEEAVSNEMTPEMIKEFMETVMSEIASIKEQLGSQVKEVEDSMEEKEKAIEDKVALANQAIDNASSLMNKVESVASKLVSDYVPPSLDNKHETLNLPNMSPEIAQKKAMDAAIEKHRKK